MVKNRTFSVLVFMLAGLSGMLSYNRNVHAQDLTTAIDYSKSEQFDKAASVFEQIIQNDPNNSKAYFFYGENQLLDYFADSISNSLTVAANQAKELYSKGIQADSIEPLNYVGLAKVAFYLEEDDKAEQLRAKAKSLLPPYKKVRKIENPEDYAYTLAKIAESYIRKGSVDTSLALPLIREAVKIDKTNPDIYIIAGDIYILVKDGSNAIRNYKRAQDYDPTSPTANMKIGSIYVRGLNLMAAIPYYEAAIELDEDYAPAYRELGQLYSMAGRFDQSKEYFQKYLELTKGNIPAKIRYVNALYYAKEYDEVVNTVEEIFEVDQSRSYMNRIAAYSCYDKENPDIKKAQDYIEALFETIPPENIIKKDYIYKAKIFLKKHEDYPDLLRDTTRIDRTLERERSNYENMSSRNPNRGQTRERIESLNQRKDSIVQQIIEADAEIDKAFESYQKALEYDPDDINLLSEIATNYYAYRRFEGAARTWEKMIDLGRDDVNNYMQIGRAYYMARNYKKADSIFTIVTQKFPDNIQSYLMIARTYSQMDPDLEKGLAKPKFEKFLEKASVDTVANAREMVEAFGYLGYYYLKRKNYSKADEWYDRMINIDPDNQDFLIRGYTGKANVWFMMSELAGELDEKIPYFDKAISYHQKVLDIDPDNRAARSSIQYINSVKRNTLAHINPNEIRGVIRNESGQPINEASVRVKDTAAETLTNSRGEFKFEIPKSSEALLVKANGYQMKEVPVTNSRIYNVVLEKE
jgi:tetratricopeptide (TPR) repeat protein